MWRHLSRKIKRMTARLHTDSCCYQKSVRRTGYDGELTHTAGRVRIASTEDYCEQPELQPSASSTTLNNIKIGSFPKQSERGAKTPLFFSTSISGLGVTFNALLDRSSDHVGLCSADRPPLWLFAVIAHRLDTPVSSTATYDITITR